MCIILLHVYDPPVDILPRRDGLTCGCHFQCLNVLSFGDTTLEICGVYVSVTLTFITATAKAR